MKRLLYRLPLLSLLFYLAYAQTPHGVLVQWTASTSTVVGYNVYRGTSASGPFTKLTASPVTGTSYLDPTTDLTISTSYVYQVTAVDSNGDESVASNQATVTTPTTFPTNPNPPSGCSAKNQ